MGFGKARIKQPVDEKRKTTFADVAGADEEKEELREIEDDVRTAGAKVIALKGATYYAVAMAVRRICECIIRDTDSVMTVSAMIHNQYGINDVCLSLPFVVGAAGLKRAIIPPLTDGEKAMLHKSADALKEVISQLNI